MRRLAAGAALSSCLAYGAALTAAEPGERISPLDRLQQRSAETRWDQARTQWTTGQQVTAAANQPAAVSPVADLPEIESPVARPFVADQSDAFGTPARATVTDVAPDAPTAPAARGSTTPAAPVAGHKPATPRIDPFASIDETPGIPDVEPVTLPMPDDHDIRQVTGRTAPARTSAALIGVLQAPPQAPPAEGTESLDSPATEPGLQVPNSQGLDFRPISDIQPFFDYSPDGDDPCTHLCPLPGGCPEDPNLECPDDGEVPIAGSPERYFPHLEFYWTASNLYQNPLYFSNPALERYGHVHYHDCVEPAFSMARFGVQLASLPYQMALDPAWRRQYDLGWYRPGDFAPKLIYQPPLNARAAATSAGVYTGLFFLAP